MEFTLLSVCLTFGGLIVLATVFTIIVAPKVWNWYENLVCELAEESEMDN